MQVLTEHVGRDECQSRFGYTESALPVIVWVFADNGAVRDYCTSIDDRAVNAAFLTNIHIGQHDRLMHSARENNNELLTFAPDITQPPETMD